MTGKAKIKLRRNAIATALKYITLAVYAAATSFVCLVVFISATGDFDRSTEGLLPLMPVGTEALYFVIVISVYAIVRMCGGGNLKIFYAISAVPIFLAYGSFVCRDFVFLNGTAGAASVLLTGIVRSFVFFFRHEFERPLRDNVCFAVFGH